MSGQIHLVNGRIELLNGGFTNVQNGGAEEPSAKPHLEHPSPSFICLLGCAGVEL